MMKNKSIPGPNDKETFVLPQSWQDQIVSEFERLEVSPFPEQGAYEKSSELWRERCLPKYSMLLDLLAATSTHPSTTARIAELLLRKLKLALRPNSSLAISEAHFIVSKGFAAYVRMSRVAGGIDRTLEPLLKAATPRYSRLAGFLEAMLAYEEELERSGADLGIGNESDSSDGNEDPCVPALLSNLSSPSHELRLASLKLLGKLAAPPDHAECLTTMVQLEEMPFDFHLSIRAIAVHMRRLGQSYQQLSKGSWLRQAIPTFLFGMMTVKMSPVWKDAASTLKQVAQDHSGEECICDLAFAWLEVDSYRNVESVDKNPLSATRVEFTEFDCPQLIKFAKLAVDAKELSDEAVDVMRENFDLCQNLEDQRPLNARSQALRVFAEISALAEKRSRRLVPFLLSWTRVSPEREGSPSDEEPSTEVNWSLPDRKALLGVFSQFVNPRVLYQHDRVYDALLGLLENGDVEIQKVVLKAILAWKQDGVKPYQENLEYLLDEARFKNELTVLLQGDQQIKAEHRSELMPVLLRLLYGRTISKKGIASGRGGLQATRLAVLRNLDEDALATFLEIALGSLRGIRIVDESGLIERILKLDYLPARKQVGFLNMMEAIIKELGVDVAPYTENLTNAVLHCLITACRKLSGEVDDGDVEGNDGLPSEDSLLRNVRSTGLKCLNLLLQNAQKFDWTAYRDAIIQEVFSPRIEKLSVETAQGISGSLRLLSTFATLPKTASFLGSDLRIVKGIVDVLNVPKAKNDVKIFVLGIINSLASNALAPATESEFNDLIKEEIILPNMDNILTQINATLTAEEKPAHNVVEACVDTIVQLSPIIEESSKVDSLATILLSLLGKAPGSEGQKSHVRIDPRTKGRILLILEKFVTRDEIQANENLKQGLYTTISSLFGFFLDSQNRQVLSRLLLAFASKNPELQTVAELCEDLNSYAANRLEEPDYDRRLKAFSTISRSLEQPAFTSATWAPILHNLVFYMQKDEEFGILSSNSAGCLCRFISDCAGTAAGSGGADDLMRLLSDVVVRAIENSSRDSSEAVRREYLRVFGHLASKLPTWGHVSDLASLLGDPLATNEEPLFFFNILSPAVSKQLDALQTLVDANKRSEISSRNLSHYFIPLLEHFIFDRVDGSDDKGLGAAATIAIADLAASLEWRQYRPVLRRYIGYASSKPELQKQVIRLLVKVVDTLETAAIVKAKDADSMQELDDAQSRSRLSFTLPVPETLNEDILNGFLPPLLGYLHDKDESTVSARVPVGIIVAKLLNLLPTETRRLKLPGVLTDICHILRSKAWESREMARQTLSAIASVLGPSYFGFILSELRGALTRGYQLHVLSYTMHSILVEVIPKFQQGDLDYCLTDIVTIVLDDIFGVVGMEKDAEEYISKMKEVKSSKSQDSMELVSRTASITHLIDLIKPLQSLLMEKLNLRTVRKIDELLSRVAAGLVHNPAAESQDTLIFCYEVIQEVYKTEKVEEAQKLAPKLRRYLVQRGAQKSGDRGSTNKYTHKLVRFSLDILRSVFRRYDSLRVAHSVAGLIQLLGDAVVGSQEEVKIAAFKLISVLDKVLSDMDDGLPLLKVASKEASKSISTSADTTSDVAQAALKLKSDILRVAPGVPVKPADVDLLLGKIKDDLTEPLYRSVTFNFLRAVLTRKVESAVVYDTLDYVGTVMITNDDLETRNLARGAFFQFLQNYPQKKGRWAKQINFIVANLKYDREGGRISVMEVVHQLLSKSSDEFIQEIAATCFVPLVFVLANDDSEKCRTHAAALLRQIFAKADKERTQKFLALLRSWVDQTDNPAVMKLGLHTFGLYFDSKEPAAKDKKDFALSVAKIGHVLEDSREPSSDWELVDSSLKLFGILAHKYPEKLLSAESKGFWSQIQDLLSYRNQTVRLSCIGLVSLYVEDFVRNGANKVGTPRLEGSHGIVLDQDDISQLMRKVVAVLRGDGLDEALAEDVVKVIAFLSMYLDASAKDGLTEEDDDQDEDADKGEGESEVEDERVDIGEGEDDKEESEDEDGSLTNLHHMFRTLSAILRKETPPLASELIPKTAAMQIMQSICAKLPASSLSGSVRTILRPLHNLTDPSIPSPFSTDAAFKTRHDELKTRAQAVMEQLQKKLGAAEYSAQLLAVREAVKGKRQSRSGKRKIEAVAQPEKWGREKRKKFEKKKERRKEKGKQYRSARRGY